MALEKPIIVVYEGDDSVVDKMKEEYAKYCTEKYNSEGTDINHVLENTLTKDPICILKTGSSLFFGNFEFCVYTSLEKPALFNWHGKRRDLLAKGLLIPKELADVSLACQTQLIVCEVNAGAYNLERKSKICVQTKYI